MLPQGCILRNQGAETADKVTGLRSEQPERGKLAAQVLGNVALFAGPEVGRRILGGEVTPALERPFRLETRRHRFARQDDGAALDAVASRYCLEV